MKYAIIGGAGFIGSHVTRAILREEADAEIVIFDNFSSGRMWHLGSAKDDKRLEIIRGEISDFPRLADAVRGADVVYHFAANPDISKAVTQPDIDFWEGTHLTNNVLEAMRTTGVSKLIYASGSGVYGEVPLEPVGERYPDMRPISTYGASKLGCEALISAYSFMFGVDAAAFRFANVVGPNQTHGVGYDFARRLLKDGSQLRILGDGTQDKSYIYVDDVISAMRLVEKGHLRGFEAYNVATEDSITVTQIADCCCSLLGLGGVAYDYTGGDRGWKGDVPVIRMDSSKIKALGWKSKHNSREAIMKSLQSILEDARADRRD